MRVTRQRRPPRGKGARRSSQAARGTVSRRRGRGPVMNESIQYVMADFEPRGIIPLVIGFLYVVAMFIKFLRRGEQQTPPPPPPAQPIGRARSAEDELRSFLEQLSGGQPAPPPAAPAQQPAAAPPRQPGTRAAAFESRVQGASAAPTARASAFEGRVQGSAAVQAPRQRPVQPVPGQARRIVQPVAAPPPIPRAAARPARPATPATPPASKLSSAIEAGSGAAGRGRGRNVLSELRDRGSVQKAILLREILGEPIALRRPNMSTQPTGSPCKRPDKPRKKILHLPPEDDSLLLNLGHSPR